MDTLAHRGAAVGCFGMNDICISPAFSKVANELDYFAGIRHDIHRYPETAFEEIRTSNLVAGLLTEWGLEVTREIGGTGVVGIMRRGSGKRTIGLRADMDALDLNELNDFAYRSEREGKMHACGHDGHTTGLLAAAWFIAQHASFDGTVTFIFQPAEENEGGGKRMIDDGLFDRFPCDVVFGLHNIPGIPLGEFAVGPGAMMAGFDVFRIRFAGCGGHAAMPQNASDPIPAIASFISAAQTVVSRNIAPAQSAVLSITKIEAGTAYNIIPESAGLSGTVRYFSPETQILIERRLREIAIGIASAHNVEVEIFYERRYPATINTPEEAAFCADVISELFGESQINRQPMPLMAAEDFAFMLNERPGAYVWIGNGVDCPMVHNPHYDFNDRLLPYVASYWTALVERMLPCHAD